MTTTRPEPELGTISHGTMRTEDLHNAFYHEIGRLNPSCPSLKEWASRDGSEGEDAEYDVEEMFDVLNEMAPPLCYFGAHEGDGSDYGFWICWEALEDGIADGEIVKFNAGEPMPTLDRDSYQFYALEVTDHGNATLYAADGTEIWSAV